MKNHNITPKGTPKGTPREGLSARLVINGANVTLNFSPQPDGHIMDKAKKILSESFGDSLAANGRASLTANSRTSLVPNSRPHLENQILTQP
jgi:alpha-L-fucosidase